MASPLASSRAAGLKLACASAAFARVIRGRVPAHHRRGGVAQQILHVELPGVVLDRPGGEGVAEAVRVGWTPARSPSRVNRVPRRYLFIGRCGSPQREMVRNNGPSLSPRKPSM